MVAIMRANSNRPLKKNLNIKIIQSIVPTYRVAFFERLSNCRNFTIEVLAGTWEPVLNLKSVAQKRSWMNLQYRLAKVFSGKLLWQRGVVSFEILKSTDVVVLSGNPRILSNYFLIALARYRKVAIVWWGQGWTAGSNGIRTAVKRRIMRLCDVIAVYTESEARALKAAGFLPDRVFGINNTIETSEIDANMAFIATAYRGEFGRQTGFRRPKLVLFCGRLTKKAAVDQLLRAFAMANDTIPDMELIIIGDGEEYGRLKALSEELSLSEKIKWLGAIYHEKELSKWFLKADVFVYPGSVGLSLLHAFSYGLACLIHDEPKLHMPEADALRDGVNGLTFKYGDSASLAAMLTRLMRDEPLRKMLGERAKKTMCTRYSMNNMVAEMKKAIEKAHEVAMSDKCKPIASKRYVPQNLRRSIMAMMKKLRHIARVIRRIFLIRLCVDNETKIRIYPRSDLAHFGSHYGGWVVPTGMFAENSVCYCVGVGEDVTFDLELIERFGCEVYAFDPTPKAISYVERSAFPPRFHFFDYGIWNKDTEIKFYVPKNSAHVSHSALNLQKTEKYFVGRVKRLSNVMKELGHTSLDLLKLDIEGAEYVVIDSLLEDEIDIKILCVEYDECTNPLDDQYQLRVAKSVSSLISGGYRLVNRSGASNYTFVISRNTSSKGR